jgi:CHAD domain-containing protein
MALRLMHQPEPGSELGPGVPLDRSMPAARAMGLILARLYQHVVSNQAGVIAQLDTEFLHDFRVAIRRARSVLRRAAGAVDEDRSGRLAEELKWLADLTSPVRDLDVHIEDLESAGRPELRPLADHLREHQAKARACLVKGIQSGRYRRLLGDWEGLTSGPAGQRGAEPAGEFADQRIARAYGRVIDRGAAIDDSSPPEALHDLRKRAKELRYLLECFQTLYPDPARTATVRELKALQDNLGRYQDGQVQAATLRSLAEDLLKSRSAPAATLMAMGGLAEELDQRQTQARADFSQRFNRFASKANRSRMADLVRGD